MDILNDFLQSAIDLAVPLIGVLVVIFYRYIARQIAMVWVEAKAHVPMEVAYAIEFAARLGVDAAEQYARSGQLDLDGRKDRAIEVAERYLQEQGYDINLDVIDDAIESVIGSINRNRENS